MHRTATALTLILAAGSAMAEPLWDKHLTNPTAYIPSQCYTNTLDEAGNAYNPCFTCHVDARAPNYIVGDEDLQTEYAFPRAALKNPWTNLFVDRSAAIAAVSDAEIDAYVAQSNYFDADGTITLARKLANPPANWDEDGDGAWAGYIPDCHFNFDAEGFDHAPDGTPTGWRAFAYVPLPGGFWPTNGSTDDVLIRLAEPFRTDETGAYDPEIYKVNLAITEALIQRADVAIDPVDETRLGVDLDKDGTLGTADHIAYDWMPIDGRFMSWVGAAKGEKLAAGLFPLGTEFLHTVRYIDVSSGAVSMAPRIKEVRYGIKSKWQTYADLEQGGLAEVKERAAFPDRIDIFDGGLETGIANGTGWRYQAFIEDAAGDLRPQSFEETVFCIGCHGGVSVTDDAAYAFPRKLPSQTAHARGWYHWTQKSLAGTPEPVRADGQRELLTYLQENGAGDEFRNNAEIIARFIAADGSVDPQAAAELEQDISTLLFPSPERARTLNKAYREIVLEQSYVRGRDAVAMPAANVHREVEQNQPTGIVTPVRAARW
ncbi:hypothetical protein [Rhodovulum adriaticum]|uniref:Lipoprotein n=1 Tax=Rhodovulum adriaticum TaxID=35804 RepID=A0A4R2NI42_RHOAD|nr:hypothetical protein [Rhodovulum adriaticum]MBK1635416.1 hypothetical protein [Rhodovulum adriaticum]TCP21123.1 hypothetical protein EV656_11344 [Rhodovulum adriaticum]